MSRQRGAHTRRARSCATGCGTRVDDATPNQRCLPCIEVGRLSPRRLAALAKAKKDREALALYLRESVEALELAANRLGVPSAALYRDVRLLARRVRPTDDAEAAHLVELRAEAARYRALELEREDAFFRRGAE